MLLLLYFVFFIITHASFFYVFFRLDLKRSNKIPVGIVFLASFALLCYLSIVVSEYLQLLYVIPCFLWCWYLFDIGFFVALKYWLIAFPCISIIASALDFIFITFLNVEDLVSSVISSGVIIGLFWLYYFFAGRKLPYDSFRIKGRLWIAISLAFFIIEAMLSYFTYVLPLLKETGDAYVGSVLVFAGGVTVVIAIFAIIFFSNKKQKLETETTVLQEFNKQQKIYFEHLLDREQKTKKFRHDITADLALVQNYMEKGKIQDAKRYLNEMSESVNEIRKQSFSVGNEIIDTLLNFYLQPYIGKCRINIYGVVDNELKIPIRELSVVISNVLKNAVEAVCGMQAEKRRIIFEANQGLYYLNIKIKNTFSVPPVIDNKTNTFTTTKNEKGDHGFGLINVKDALEKNGGELSFFIEDDMFVTDVSLKVGM